MIVVIIIENRSVVLCVVLFNVRQNTAAEQKSTTLMSIRWLVNAPNLWIISDAVAAQLIQRFVDFSILCCFASFVCFQLLDGIFIYFILRVHSWSVHNELSHSNRRRRSFPFDSCELLCRWRWVSQYNTWFRLVYMTHHSQSRNISQWVRSSHA